MTISGEVIGSKFRTKKDKTSYEFWGPIRSKDILERLITWEN